MILSFRRGILPSRSRRLTSLANPQSNTYVSARAWLRDLSSPLSKWLCCPLSSNLSQIIKCRAFAPRGWLGVNTLQQFRIYVCRLSQIYPSKLSRGKIVYMRLGASVNFSSWWVMVELGAFLYLYLIVEFFWRLDWLISSLGRLRSKSRNCDLINCSKARDHHWLRLKLCRLFIFNRFFRICQSQVAVLPCRWRSNSSSYYYELWCNLQSSSQTRLSWNYTAKKSLLMVFDPQSVLISGLFRIA